MVMSMLQKGQAEFLRRGGILELPLNMLREKGILPEEGSYVYQEYPKALNLSLGVQEFPLQTETCQGKTISWTEHREVIAPMVVESEAQEDAVRAAFERAQELGITVQAHWPAALLLHTVGVAERPKVNRSGPRPTPEQIKAERVARLKAELATLEPSDSEIETAASSSAVANPLAIPAAKRRGATAVTDLPVVAPDPAA
jgi:hypothetical protein